jgi:uncharacterized C2H2 Zn-finger protein
VDGVPQLKGVTVQDHGGNYWRHGGSLNADREWHLEDTDASLSEKIAEIYRAKKEPEPIRCPKCTALRHGGPRCPRCGFAYPGHKRIIVEATGRLREVHGDIYKPRKIAEPRPELESKWISCVFRCKRTGKTFRQAKGLFMHENGYMEPGPDYPYQPLHPSDWYEKVADVPNNRLKLPRAHAV